MSKGWREMNGQEVYIVQDGNYDAGYEDGLKDAEERIIKLLDSYCDSNHSALDGCECSLTLALIRKEGK